MEPSLQIAVAVRPAAGFAVSGDVAMFRRHNDRVLLAVIDVLGHGPDAAALASRAESLLEDAAITEVEDLLALLHRELHRSLGAAAGLAVIDPSTGEGRYVGVGNTVARIFGNPERRLRSIDGIVGHRHATARPDSFTLHPGETLLLHTDGISSRLALAEYPQFFTEDPRISARELLRRFARDHDDAACIVARRTS